MTDVIAIHQKLSELAASKHDEFQCTLSDDYLAVRSAACRRLSRMLGTLLVAHDNVLPERKFKDFKRFVANTLLSEIDDFVLKGSNISIVNVLASQTRLAVWREIGKIVGA